MTTPDPVDVLEGLNEVLNAARAKAEETSGYTRWDINEFVSRWSAAEKQGVMSFDVPEELAEFFLARYDVFVHLRSNPELYEHITYYQRPIVTV